MFLTTRGQIGVLKDEFAKGGLCIIGLEQKLTALTLHTAKIVDKKPHKEPNAGDEDTDPAAVRGDDRAMLAKLTPFSGDPTKERMFMNLFLARAQQCSDEQRHTGSDSWLAQAVTPGLRAPPGRFGTRCSVIPDQLLNAVQEV